MVRNSLFFLRALLLLIFTGLFSCRRSAPPEISFYYWKTVYRLDSTGKQVLQANDVQTLYLRYFDLVWDGEKGGAVPQAVLQLRDSLPGTVVPVIFIRNQVLEQVRDSAALDTLAQRILQLTGTVSARAGISAGALQLDCDWTKGTARAYFHLIRSLKRQLAGVTQPGFSPDISLSATIRLHQVKYPDQCGVPPVDRGVLMYYNMGSISSSHLNSIYDRSQALKYLPALERYTLPLDIALPLFAWGIHIRDGQVLGLLNGMDSRDMQDGFNPAGNGRYRAQRSFFCKGFYFREGDEVKLEEISGDALLEMAEDIHRHNRKYIQQIIFYDLDSQHISRYDPQMFKKVARYIN